MAIRGHSYGGYMSSYTSLFRPGTFQVALVGAPVTDWRLYDSVYAERYMGLLPDSERAYINSAVTTYAEKPASPYAHCPLHDGRKRARAEHLPTGHRPN